jgi:hypothetical protein
MNLQLGLAFRLLMRTSPILLVRVGAYFLFWVVLLVVLVVIFGIAYLFSLVNETVGFFAGLIGFILLFPAYIWINRYVFFLIKGAHLAVVARLLHHGKLPAGVNQFEWGKQQVRERFGEVSVMFLVDQMVRRVVGRFSRQVMRAARWIPGKFGRRVSNMVSRLLRFSTNYIDEAILARSFWREEDVWQGARDGLILYAMSWRTLLPNALALMLLSYVPVMGMVLILVIPVGLLLSVVSGTTAVFVVVAALVLAWLTKLALGDSFAMIAMVAAYHRATRDLDPDFQLEKQLEQISPKFREIQQKVGQVGR